MMIILIVLALIYVIMFCILSYYEYKNSNKIAAISGVFIIGGAIVNWFLFGMYFANIRFAGAPGMFDTGAGYFSYIICLIPPIIVTALAFLLRYQVGKKIAKMKRK